MIKSCQILQSGFISPASPNFVKADDMSDQTINSDIANGRPIKERLSPFFYHSGLNNLAVLESNNHQLINDFEFRERLLRANKDAFGLSSFFDWCLLQKDSPYFTKLHLEFMRDTFNFIRNGTRKVTASSWLALLEAPRSHQPDPMPFNNLNLYFQKEIPNFFSTYLSQYKEINNTLVLWTSQEGGFSDLFCFSKIVFGKTYNRRVW